ncbi:MAG: hypothetical protein ACOCWB_01335 [Bacteroidota bacterium]
MSKRLFYFLNIFLFSFLILSTQCRSRRDVFIPEQSPEQAQKEVDEKVDKMTQEPDKPLRKGQIRRNMRKRDKIQRQEYEDHHDRIQAKEVRKRMKKSKRKAQAHNNRKRPNVFRTLFTRFTE